MRRSLPRGDGSGPQPCSSSGARSRALAARLLPPSGLPAPLSTEPRDRNQLQTTHCRALPRATLAWVSLWLVIPANHSELPQSCPASYPYKNLQVPSGFSSLTTWVVEGCVLLFTPANNFSGYNIQQANSYKQHLGIALAWSLRCTCMAMSPQCPELLGSGVLPLTWMDLPQPQWEAGKAWCPSVL